jgi:hypothetical protein
MTDIVVTVEQLGRLGGGNKKTPIIEKVLILYKFYIYRIEGFFFFYTEP